MLLSFCFILGQFQPGVAYRSVASWKKRVIFLWNYFYYKFVSWKKLFGWFILTGFYMKLFLIWKKKILEQNLNFLGSRWFIANCIISSVVWHIKSCEGLSYYVTRSHKKQKDCLEATKVLLIFSFGPVTSWVAVQGINQNVEKWLLSMIAFLPCLWE